MTRTDGGRSTRKRSLPKNTSRDKNSAAKKKASSQIGASPLSVVDSTEAKEVDFSVQSIKQSDLPRDDLQKTNSEEKAAVVVLSVPSDNKEADTTFGMAPSNEQDPESYKAPSNNKENYRATTEYSFELNKENSPSVMAPLNKIVLPSSQPRRYFDKDKMDSLTLSVRSSGVLQPVLVRPLPDGNYELVAGERRLKAASNVGLSEIPVNVLAMSDSEAAQYALTENLLREDLNPLDEAEAILQLLTLRLECSLDKVALLLYRMDNSLRKKSTGNILSSKEAFIVEQVFSELGKITWQSFIRTRLPLLNLQEDVLEVLRAGRIEYTKALEIAKVKSDDDRAELLDNAIEYDLSLKEIRAEVKKYNPAPQKAELQTRMENAYNNFKKSKAWDNPELRDKLAPLLSQMEVILGIES
ncbi:chromosome partitioning protein, ParB family (plasmid) [Calothrix sp. NIES-4071]|nr:chromosome partitioning protein, ParB family [Calothrix sp. NIES-4071]BAZ65175.1 chromosome partitioning protein, ParB family [Calothrix sp. NIES-4105]